MKTVFTAPEGVELITESNGGRIPQREYNRLCGIDERPRHAWRREPAPTPQLMAGGVPYDYATYGGASFPGRACFLYTNAHQDNPRQVQAAINQAGREGYTRVYLIDTLAQ